MNTALAILAICVSGDARFSQRDVAIASADYVGVVRYVGGEGSYKSNWGDDPAMPNVIYRHRFTPVVNLVGAPSDIVVLADNEVGKNDSFKARVRPGHVYLAHMFKPDANRHMKGSVKGDKYVVFENTNQYYLTGDNNPVRLYDITYTSRGESVFEKYAYILAQSYAVDRLYETLGAIIASAPSSTSAQTKPFFEPYKAFYASQVRPVLDAGSDDDVRLRLRVFSTHASILGGDSITAFHRLVSQVERTWPDAQYPIIFGLLNNDDSFNRSLLQSRMPSAKSEAVSRLTKEGTGNKTAVIAMLQDPNLKVRRTSILWLHSYALATKLNPAPPVPDWKPDGTARNEAAIRKYWEARG